MSGAAPPPDGFRGFILQSSCQSRSGRPVIHLYGKLETGESFLLREHREIPALFLRAADAERARGAIPTRPAPSGKVNFQGEPVLRVQARAPSGARLLRERLAEAGIPCYEADVRPAQRYLIDRGIRGSLRIRGPSRPGTGISRVFDDPEVSPADFSPRLAVLSLHVEVEPESGRLLAIALAGCCAAEVLLLTPPGLPAPPEAVACATEEDLLRALVRRVRELDPDVLTGWDVISSDLVVLSHVAGQLGVPLELGRGGGTLRLQPARTLRGSPSATIPGRLVLDGIGLLRGAFVQMKDDSLDAVAQQVLGRPPAPGGEDPGGRLRLFASDRERFAGHVLGNARLALEILTELRLLDLAVERSRLTGVPPDRVAASIASFDFLYLLELSRRGIVAPTAGAETDGGGPITGGEVLAPRPGLYRNVLTFDFRSLYPSIIRTFQIDPLGLLPGPAATADPIVAPSGAAFRREPGILPGMLDALFPMREAARAQGDIIKSQAIKILMNSFYGVLGTPVSRFYNPDLANAITSFGRELLRWSRDRIEARGYPVLYGDTDSLFVLSGVEDPALARLAGQELARDLNRDLAEHIRETWRVPSRLELQLDRLYLRLILPLSRQGTEGARKRYAGLVEDRGQQRVVFTGMEAVRRDWTQLAGQVQRNLYERLFTDRPVDAYLREVVAALHKGRLDDLLVYRKALRKDLGEYTTNAPHVAAARKLAGPPERLLSYVMTTAGPEPAAQRQHPLDYEHYLQRQIRPVAEPVLVLLRLTWDRVLQIQRQMELYH